MGHYSDQTWRHYVEDRLDETTRNTMEEHLAHCDECLERYLWQLEQVDIPLPDPVKDGSVVEEVMKRVTSDDKKKHVSVYRRHLINYVIAAAMTLLLTASGLFQTIIDSTDLSGPRADKPPVSEQVLERTLTFFDAFSTNKKEGQSQ